MDDPGRIAYQSTVTMQGKCSGSSCFFTFPPVPAGHRVVIQHISGALSFQTTGASVSIFTGLTTAVVPVNQFYAPVAALGSLFNEPVQLYFDEGQTFHVVASLSGGAFSTGASLAQQITLTGYLLDCVAATCSPIGH